MYKFLSFFWMVLGSICMGMAQSAKDSTTLASQTSAVDFQIRPNLCLNRLVIRPGRRHRADHVVYGFAEIFLSGYTPFYQRIRPKSQGDVSFLTLLATGSMSSTRISLASVATKSVLRASAGIRLLYSPGRKSIFMVSASPFLSESVGTLRQAVPRMFANALYTRVVNEYFSYRLGITYTYLFNGGSLLPLLGFRVGRYDKVHFNFQLPRDISLVFPINNSFQLAICSRLSGGIYRFNEVEALSKFREIKGNLTFYRSDLLTGILVNYSPNSRTYLSMHAGVAYRRNVNIAFSSEFIPTRGHIYKDAAAQPGIFVQFQLAHLFGSPTYNGHFNQLIELKAANNAQDAGNFNTGALQQNTDLNQVGIKDISKKDAKKINSQLLDLRDVLQEE